MKTYIGTKIIQAEPAYRVSNDHAHHIIVTDPVDAYANYPDVEAWEGAANYESKGQNCRKRMLRGVAGAEDLRF